MITYSERSYGFSGNEKMYFFEKLSREISIFQVNDVNGIMLVDIIHVETNIFLIR